MSTWVYTSWQIVWQLACHQARPGLPGELLQGAGARSGLHQACELRPPTVYPCAHLVHHGVSKLCLEMARGQASRTLYHVLLGFQTFAPAPLWFLPSLVRATEKTAQNPLQLGLLVFLCTHESSKLAHIPPCVAAKTLHDKHCRGANGRGFLGCTAAPVAKRHTTSRKAPTLQCSWCWT